MRHVINPVTKLLTRTPLGRRLPNVVVLRFVGRRSGTRYSVPVVAHDVDGAIVVFTDAGWAANFRAGIAVSVRRAGSTFTATGTRIEDPVQSAHLIRSAVTRDGARALGLAVAEGCVPTDDELNAARFVLVLDPGHAPGRTIPDS
jgi:F420H(2)-dependent quinone reductase